MIRTPAKIGIALGLLASFAFGQVSRQPLARFRVLCSRSIPMARALSYPTRRFRSTVRLISKLKATTKGKSVVSAIPAGSYAITAQHRNRRNVTAATVSEVELEMKVQAVAESTTVTASAEPASPFEDTAALLGSRH